MSLTWPLWHGYKVTNGLKICASIVKSHRDLSSFFNTTLNLSSPFRENSVISLEGLACAELMPILREKYGVTNEDWMKCGFKPKLGIDAKGFPSLESKPQS